MDAASGEAPDTRRRIQSIEVGFRVIRALISAAGPIPLRDIAAAAAMPASKAHLYLASFVKEGMAFQDAETGHYGLGPFAVRLGLSAIRQLSIVDEARQHLQRLSQRTGCAAYLSLLSENGAAIVSKVDGLRHGALSVRLGYVLPFTTSASGHCFLAFLPPARTAALLDRLYAGAESKAAAQPPRQQLEAALVKALKRGYATSSGHINTNFAAAAAPVFDHGGGIAATLTILGPDSYLTAARLKTCVPELLEAATSLSHAMGAP